MVSPNKMGQNGSAHFGPWPKWVGPKWAGLACFPSLGNTTLKKELNFDALLTKLRKDISLRGQTQVGFTMMNGILFYKGRLVIPKTSQLIPVILAEFHSSPIKGIQEKLKHTKD